MAKFTSEKVTPTRAKLTAKVTYDELGKYVKQAYKNIAEQVQIPGFRKGKVPAPVIDQRIGREAVMQEAVNLSLDDFYRGALEESGEKPLGRPTADVEKWPDPAKPKSTLVLVFEVEVRPEFELPKYEGLKLEVEAAEVGEEAVEAELTKLRERFGNLNTVDRPAKKGDFVELDLVASIDGKQVDQASGVSYELGSGTMLEGMDDAIETLTAGESTTFTSQLLGGEHEGKDAEVSVTVVSVKERELAEANDDFAQLASEFETLAELRESLAEQVAKQAVYKQGQQARDQFLEKLIESAGIPISEELVEDAVRQHLESEGRVGDEEHGAEVREQAGKDLATQLLLEALVEAEGVTPTQNELMQFIFQSAQQYGVEPSQFLQAVLQGGQIAQIEAEVTRNKALAVALAKAEVVDTNGKAVDISDYLMIDDGQDDEAEGEAEAAEEKPAKKAPAKKAAAKKPAAKKAEEGAEEKPAAKKAPAKKPAAKKTAAKKSDD